MGERRRAGRRVGYAARGRHGAGAGGFSGCRHEHLYRRLVERHQHAALDIGAAGAMAVQFGTSAMATAAAALSLGERIAGDPENCRRLDGLAAVAAAGELVASAFAERRHHAKVGVGETLLARDSVGTSYKVGALALGLGRAAGLPHDQRTVEAAQPRAFGAGFVGAVGRRDDDAASDLPSGQQVGGAAAGGEDNSRLTEPRPVRNPRRRRLRDIAARTLRRP